MWNRSSIISITRSAAAIEISLALLLAFFFAPFEHVHVDSEGAHAHSGEIHAHFFPPHAAAHFTSGVQIGADDDDEHANARSLDTFTLVLPNSLPLFTPRRAPAIPVSTVETAAPIAVVEERAHDPPCLDQSTPRAPPL
jgi:hypothetical protein